MLKLRAFLSVTQHAFAVCVYLAYWALHSLDLDQNHTRLPRQCMVNKVMFYTPGTSAGLFLASCPRLDHASGFLLRSSQRHSPRLSTGVSCDECLHWASPPWPQDERASFILLLRFPLRCEMFQRPRSLKCSREFCVNMTHWRSTAAGWAEISIERRR